jgi:hypothetical protein
VTGLIWLKSAQCLGGETYAAVNQAAAALTDGQCGLTDGSSSGDWRLATKAEWEATMARAVALGCTADEGNPPSLTNDPGTGCINSGPTSFTGVFAFSGQSTSSASENNPAEAWVAALADGNFFIITKDIGWDVWPVRGGR